MEKKNATAKNYTVTSETKRILDCLRHTSELYDELMAAIPEMQYNIGTYEEHEAESLLEQHTSAISEILNNLLKDRITDNLLTTENIRKETIAI